MCQLIEMINLRHMVEVESGYCRCDVLLYLNSYCSNLMFICNGECARSAGYIPEDSPGCMTAMTADLL